MPKSSPVKEGNTFDTPSLPKATGIKFLPLHNEKSRSKDRLIGDVTMSPTVSDVKFTVEELVSRILTSHEYLQLVIEKEEKKQKARIKKRHRIEREQKAERKAVHLFCMLAS